MLVDSARLPFRSWEGTGGYEWTDEVSESDADDDPACPPPPIDVELVRAFDPFPFAAMVCLRSLSRPTAFAPGSNGIALES